MVAPCPATLGAPCPRTFRLRALLLTTAVTLALAMPPQGVWTVQAEGHRALVRTDNGAGFGVLRGG